MKVGVIGLGSMGMGAALNLAAKGHEVVGCELFDIDYFRHAFRGVLLNVGALFCEKEYIHDMPRRRRGEAIFKLQWA